MSDYLRRLEEELVRAGYDRSLRARVRRSPARPVLAAALVAAVVLVGSAGGVAVLHGLAGDPGPETAAPPAPVDRVRVSVTPPTGGKDTRFRVSFVAPRATGDVGRTRRTYVVRVHPATSRVGCVETRETFLPPAAAGARVHARLDPAAGEGAGLGWCRGPFRGTVAYVEDFACPAQGRCEVPRDFRRTRLVIARFTFRVR